MYILYILSKSDKGFNSIYLQQDYLRCNDNRSCLCNHIW